MRESIAWAAVATVVGGCSFVPAYHRPAAPVAAVFVGAGGGGGLEAADRGWRDVFPDPRLQRLIALALANNRDLSVAVLDIELAAAEHQLQRSALLPTIGAVATPSIQGTRNSASAQYQVGVGVTAFEVDLFGRVRALTAAALQDYFATAETRRSVHLALVASVAEQYASERALAEQHALAVQTLAAVMASQVVIEQRFEAGRTSELDAATAMTQVAAAQAEVARLARLEAQATNALVLLIGQPLPTDLPAPTAIAQQTVVADLPAGLSSTLLERRPDILSAEHSLEAANADIGAARAALFPTISLTAFAGLTSTALANLFTAGAFGWSVGNALQPTVTLPLFDGGHNHARLAAARVRLKIRVAQYQKAIQVAFREVSDGLVARDRYVEQRTAQEARVAAEQQRYSLSQARYTGGLENYLVVLTAQQDLYAAQQQLIDVELARMTSSIDLYKALGGGWLEHTQVAASSRP